MSHQEIMVDAVTELSPELHGQLNALLADPVAPIVNFYAEWITYRTPMRLFG